MNRTSPLGRIAVGNSALHGVSPEVPTFLLSTLGLPAARVQHEVESVGYLQAIAPVFRVVLFTDQPIVASVRHLGWPVEHIPPQEHRGRTMSADRQRHYLESRFRIARQHYHKARILTADAASYSADTIAELIGSAQLGALARTFVHQEHLHPDTYANWPSALHELRAVGTVVFESAEGSTRLSSTGRVEDATLVMGYAPPRVGAPQRPPGMPSWLCSVTAEFDPDSSIAFESHVYASLARHVGKDLSVVIPWRAVSLLLEDAMHWVDLGVRLEGSSLSVLPEFLETYELLSGTERVDWDQARRYSAVRRLSRGASNRRAHLLKP